MSSIMRIVTSVQVSQTKDVTWYILPEGLWALGEISSGIVCGCMPTLPQFFRHFVPKITSRLSSGRSNKPSAGSDSKQSAGVRMRPPRADSSSEALRTDGTSKAGGLCVWTDEVSTDDEEKGVVSGH